MRKLDRKSLDQIGKSLAKADMALSREIDRITANPELFDGVRARIRQSTAEPAPERFITARTLAGGVATVALAVAALMTWAVVFKSTPADVVVVPPVTDKSKGRDTRVSSKPDSVVTADFPRETAPPRAEKISTRPSASVSRRKQPAAQQVRYEGDFYALSYAGDPNETERGGRIVRVDVPRSTLFAMGVDVPLENGPETVKADLLIGSDGVTRAIRVVK